MTEFKDQLRAAIGGMKKQEVSDVTGYSLRTINNWETGRIIPPVETQSEVIGKLTDASNMKEARSRREALVKANVMMAYHHGENIEGAPTGLEDDALEWVSMEDPVWNWGIFTYRVAKPAKKRGGKRA